jgi:hypothetical protein
MGAIEGLGGAVLGGAGGKIGSAITKWGAGKYATKAIGRMSRSEVLSKGSKTPDLAKQQSAEFVKDWGLDIETITGGSLEAPASIVKAPYANWGTTSGNTDRNGP